MDEPLSYRLSIELIVTEPVLNAVKDYDINIPEICIAAITGEIDRLTSIIEIAPAHDLTETTLYRNYQAHRYRDALPYAQQTLEVS